MFSVVKHLVLLEMLTSYYTHNRHAAFIPTSYDETSHIYACVTTPTLSLRHE